MRGCLYWEHDDNKFMADYERFLGGNGDVGWHAMDFKYVAAYIKRRITVVWRVDPNPFVPLACMKFSPEYHIPGLTPPITLVMTDEQNAKFPNSLHKASPHFDSISLRNLDTAPPPIFAVISPPVGHTNQGPVWLQELSFPYATRPQDVVTEGKSRNIIWRQSTHIGEIMYRTRTWIWRPVFHAKSFSNVSDPHPKCTDDDEMEFIPTNELLDYRASQLHYLPPEKYLLMQSEQPRLLQEKKYADGRQKSYPPLSAKETHIVITNHKAMKTLTNDTLLKTPLPTSVFPSYRTIRNISDLEHRKCDNCGKKKKCEILCDGPQCNKGYCLKCLGLKTIPKRLLHWNTETVKSKTASILPTGPRYCPFFAKFCHPICEADLPLTSNVRFVEKVVQKRPRKTQPKKNTPALPTPSTSNKKQRISKPLPTPPIVAAVSERATKLATSVAQRWLRHNTILTRLPSINQHPIANPNHPPLPTGCTAVHLSPNKLIKCPLVKAAHHSSNHSSPGFRIIINTVTNDISIKCTNGKCYSPPIKISNNPAPQATSTNLGPQTRSTNNTVPQHRPPKRARSKSPDSPQANYRPTRRLCIAPTTSYQISSPLSQLSPANPPTPPPLPTDTPPP